MAPMEESWRHWMKDFLPQRESVNAWCFSCPPLVVSREQERRSLRKLERWDARWLSAQYERGIYSLRSVARYSDGCTFDSRTATEVHHFDNRASCTGYPDGQANCSTFQKKVHKRHDDHATIDTCCGLHQPNVVSGRNQLTE
jgi:hypothetical protein